MGTCQSDAFELQMPLSTIKSSTLRLNHELHYAGVCGQEGTSGALPKDTELRAAKASHMGTTEMQRTADSSEPGTRSRNGADGRSHSMPAAKQQQQQQQQLAWDVDLGQSKKKSARPATSRRPASARKPAYQWDDDSITVSLDSELEAQATLPAGPSTKKEFEESLPEGNAASQPEGDSDSDLELSEMLSECSLSGLGSGSERDDKTFCTVPPMTAKVSLLASPQHAVFLP